MAKYNINCPIARAMAEAGYTECTAKNGQHACNTENMNDQNQSLTEHLRNMIPILKKQTQDM